MLYLNLTTKQTYTAHQALDSCDCLVPLRLPSFSDSELEALYEHSFAQIVSKLLNLFFGKNITEREIEQCLKRNPFVPDSLDRKTLLIKLKRDNDHGISNLTNDIYNTMIQKSCVPGSWSSTAIRISLLFGIYADLRCTGFRSFDIALASEELMAVIPVCFAKKMGLPINLLIIGDGHEDDLWKLLHAGKLSNTNSNPGKLACLFYGYDPKEAERYVAECKNRTCYELSMAMCQELSASVFCSVISYERVRELISNVGKTYGKQISPEAALSYGALQDYRAVTGENNITLIIMEDYSS